MKHLYIAVRGTVTDLSKIIGKTYSAAVTGAMRKSMEAIIVNTDSTALECIKVLSFSEIYATQYLKQQRSPRMTFMPLESIKAPRVNERLRGLGGT